MMLAGMVSETERGLRKLPRGGGAEEMAIAQRGSRVYWCREPVQVVGAGDAQAEAGRQGVTGASLGAVGDVL